MNIEDYPKYEKTTPHQKKEMAKSFTRYLTGLVDLFETDSKNISYCEETLFDIIELVWKRKIYFQVFHNVNGLNELKEASLYCFWVLKLQPFLWLSSDKPNYQLNARIALWIFTNGLHFYATQKGRKINLSNDAIQNMYYSFRFRDWSKEALMDSAESLIS